MGIRVQKKSAMFWKNVSCDTE